MRTMIENPLACLSPEQIEALGQEFDAIHDDVFAELGDRDRRYITSMIAMHRRLVVLSRVLLFGSRYEPAWIAGASMLSLAKDPREHGDRPQRHGAWPHTTSTFEAIRTGGRHDQRRHRAERRRSAGMGADAGYERGVHWIYKVTRRFCESASRSATAGQPPTATSRTASPQR